MYSEGGHLSIFIKLLSTHARSEKAFFSGVRKLFACSENSLIPMKNARARRAAFRDEP